MISARSIPGLLAILFVLAALVALGFSVAGLTRSTVMVTWATASELDTAGFNLYRGESSAGPFDQVNATLIPAADDPLTGGEYTYEDQNVHPGRTYYYELESVNLDGTRENLGQIEVKAERGGWVELSLAGLFFFLAVLLKSPRKAGGQA